MTRSTLEVWSLVVTLVCLAIFTFAYLEAQSFRSPANGFPIAVSSSGLLIAAANAAVIARRMQRARRARSEVPGTSEDEDEPIFVDGQELAAPTRRRLLEGLAVFVGLFGVAFAIEFFGYVVTSVVFLVLCFRWVGSLSWRKAVLGAVIFVALFASLARLMGFVLPGALFG
jgi:hypothetical protein